MYATEDAEYCRAIVRKDKEDAVKRCLLGGE
jgi:hypothetical protein